MPSHSVWQILATVPPNAPAADRRLLKRQIRTLLKAAHLPVARDEIMMPAGRPLHVSFVQAGGRGVVMSRGVATLVENDDTDGTASSDPRRFALRTGPRHISTFVDTRLLCMAACGMHTAVSRGRMGMDSLDDPCP